MCIHIQVFCAESTEPGNNKVCFDLEILLWMQACIKHLLCTLGIILLLTLFLFQLASFLYYGVWAAGFDCLSAEEDDI